jgi:uncharacterized protein (TIGR02588 family)
MNNTDAPKTRTRAEWISLIVSIGLLGVVIGLIIWVWLNEQGTPATFRIERGAIEQVDGQYYLSVTIHNEGDTTASEVTLEGSLEVDGDEETATTTFDFVPGHSDREATLIFSADPSAADVRVISYQDP